MDLTDIVKTEFGKVKNFLFTPKGKIEMMDYLANVELKQQFAAMPEEKRKELYSRLEQHVDASMKKYSVQMDSWYQKAANVGGITTAIVDAYETLLSKIPLTGQQYLPLHKLMVMLKTVAEVPYMYSYLKESKDWIGILKWLGMKPVELILPIIGPLMGTGWTEKIVRQRIMYEAKQNFLKDIGVEVSQPYKKLDTHTEGVTGYSIQPKYSPMSAYA